jgi:hypothetical protein
LAVRVLPTPARAGGLILHVATRDPDPTNASLHGIPGNHAPPKEKSRP